MKRALGVAALVVAACVVGALGWSMLRSSHPDHVQPAESGGTFHPDTTVNLSDLQVRMTYTEALEAVEVGDYVQTVARAELDAFLATLVPSAPVAPRVAAPSSSPSYSGDLGPCGGDLPPCYVKQRESGGSYSAQNPTSSASGAWQFLDSTWGGYGGYSRAADAPPAVQDERARQLWDGGAGCSHWSAC